MRKIALISFSAILIFLTILITKYLSNTDKTLISPLINKENVLGVNLWLPNFSSEKGGPEISAKAAFFIDAQTGEVLYEKNSKTKLPIASLVKVMTVLIALEQKGLDEQFMVSERAANMEPDKMLLIAGEKLTLRELLYGIFLVSANDAAEVLAENITASRDDFINLMNIKAKQLGMQDSYFVNPTGLDEDSDNSYSTAYDLAVLTRHLVRQFPEIIEISKTEHILLPKTETHQDYDMYSGINLLTTYPGVIGFKTGYTPNAGYTLITLAQKNNHEVIGVLLDSGYRRDEARELLDYSFKKLDKNNTKR